MILQKVTDENASVALVGTRVHPFRFGDVEGQRFLDKNILAGIDAAERQRAMSLRRSGKNHTVDCWVHEDIERQRRNIALPSQYRRPRPIRVGNRRQCTQLVKIADKVLAPMSATDHRDFRHSLVPVSL